MRGYKSLGGMLSGIALTQWLYSGEPVHDLDMATRRAARSPNPGATTQPPKSAHRSCDSYSRLALLTGMDCCGTVSLTGSFIVAGRGKQTKDLRVVPEHRPVARRSGQARVIALTASVRPSPSIVAYAWWGFFVYFFAWLIASAGG
jgi:hypothetical protein